MMPHGAVDRDAVARMLVHSRADPCMIGEIQTTAPLKSDMDV
jgi:hypothetical protein